MAMITAQIETASWKRKLYSGRSAPEDPLRQDYDENLYDLGDNAQVLFTDAYDLGEHLISNNSDFMSFQGRQRLLCEFIGNFLSGANAAERSGGWRPRRMRLYRPTTPYAHPLNPDHPLVPALRFPLEDPHTLSSLSQCPSRASLRPDSALEHIRR